MIICWNSEVPISKMKFVSNEYINNGFLGFLKQVDSLAIDLKQCLSQKLLIEPSESLDHLKLR